VSFIPFNNIKKNLNGNIPKNLIKNIPDKWEKIGEVLILDLPSDLNEHKKSIGKEYAKVLNCKSVLNVLESISGEFRTPKTELIYGKKDTTTIHIENKIRFKLDPSKVMFSSGNMNERIRIGHIAKKDETIVDMFAGIGYFTLPIAVHSKPKKIYAIEKNPISYNFLSENIVLNDVTDTVKIFNGDNRELAPINVADRIIMGYFGATIRYLPTAFKCLKNKSGIIHFHDKYPDKKIPENALDDIRIEARKLNLYVELINTIKVKSYAPGISHYVFDLKIDEI